MGKRFMQLAAALLAVCLTIPPAQAAVTNQNGEIMIRVGLASASSHVPTGEMEAAHLENNNSAGYGYGYRFGYYDGNLNFVELARTDDKTIQVAVLKTQNLYYGPVNGKRTYSSSITSDILVGCYHVRLPGQFGSFGEASAEAARHEGGFVAWIDGAYQVRAGSYATQGEAQAAAAEGGSVVWTSSYGMNVVKTGTNQILFQYDCGESGRLAVQPDVTGLAETRTWFLGYKYRGGFQYHRRDGGNLTVVNVLPLEDYVNGVVCYEMGRSWPLEALKAQALCARTYVLKNLNKHNSYGFDICGTASCQAYHGMGSDRPDNGPTEVSMQAVSETAGMVIRYNGKLAETLYSSSHGGASEDAKNIWGTDTVNEHPYLRGVEDPYEADANGINSHSSWTVRYTSAQLTQRLQSRGLGTRTSLDHLVLTYSPLGNVIQVVIHWANGQSNTVKAGDIRSCFDVDAIRFTVNGAGTGEGAGSDVPSETGALYINGTQAPGNLDGKYVITGSGSVSSLGKNPYIITGSGSVSGLETPGTDGSQGGTPTQPGGGTVTVSGSSYTFSGSGWGHQVGMSQYGAYAMANRGFRYDEILTFYFPGVQIERY